MPNQQRYIDKQGFAWQILELAADLRSSNQTGLRRRIERNADRAPEAGREEDSGDERSPRRGALYFFSRGSTVVLRDYPTDWWDRSWPELEQLQRSGQVLSAEAGREAAWGSRPDRNVL